MLIIYKFEPIIRKKGKDLFWMLFVKNIHVL